MEAKGPLEPSPSGRMVATPPPPDAATSTALAVSSVSTALKESSPLRRFRDSLLLPAPGLDAAAMGRRQLMDTIIAWPGTTKSRHSVPHLPNG